MNSTKDLLKEYKMIIKWREKQQIALQQRLEDLYEKHNSLVLSTTEEKQKYTDELETLSKKVNAQTQKNCVLAKSHFKKEQNIEKLVELLDKERNSFAKEREIMSNKLRKSEKLVVKYKNEASLLKEKYDQRLLELVDAAAESHFCPWSTSMIEDTPTISPQPLSSNAHKKTNTNETAHTIDVSRKNSSSTINNENVDSEDEHSSIINDELSDNDFNYSKPTTKKTLSTFNGAVINSGDTNIDIQSLLLEVEMLKCELDSNQELLSCYRRANIVLKRETSSADHISESEKCFDTQSVCCQVDMEGTESLAKMHDEASNAAKVQKKELEQKEAKLFEMVKVKVCATVAAHCVCSCCNEIFNKPQIVDPCGHTFCYECLATSKNCFICNVPILKTVPNLTLETLCCNILVDICSKRVNEKTNEE
eukprot:g549.t1